MRSAALFGPTLAVAVLASLPVTSEPASLERIEAAIDLSLPPDSEILGVSEDGAIDSFLRAKLSMSPDGFGALVESVDLADKDFEEARRYLLGQNEDWWDPQAPAILPTAQGTTAPGRIVNLGVDWSDPARPTVYMVWHSI